jgi:hypothetical protein
MQPESAEVTAHPARSDVRLGQPEELRQQWPQLFMGESLGLEAEQNQHGQEGLDARVSEAEGGSALILDLDRLLEFLEGLGAEVAIMGDFFHLQDTPIGGAAHLPPLGQVVQAATAPEGLSVVEGRLGAHSPAFLVVLPFGVYRFGPRPGL